MRRIYLDHNASTVVDPRVLAAMVPWLGTACGNPGSLHAEGRAARRTTEDARDEVALLIGAAPSEIIFMSGATEANATALRGALAAGRRHGRLVVSSVEHACVLETVASMEKEGWTIARVPVGRDGRVDLAAFGAALALSCDGAVLMAANNETGAIQPFQAVGDLCAARGVPLLVDAAQAPGKMPFNVAAVPGLALAVLSAHKFGGPKGVGALWVRRETKFRPLLVGGGQERDRRAGTENVPAIAGFGVAARLAREELASRQAALLGAETAFLGRLRERGVVFERFGPTAASDRLPGTICLRVPNRSGEGLVLGLDLRGVAVGLGAACSSGAAKPSHVLAAMGLGRQECLETLRVSCGSTTSSQDAEEAADRMVALLAAPVDGTASDDRP